MLCCEAMSIPQSQAPVEEPLERRLAAVEAMDSILLGCFADCQVVEVGMVDREQASFRTSRQLIKER